MQLLSSVLALFYFKIDHLQQEHSSFLRRIDNWKVLFYIYRIELGA